MSEKSNGARKAVISILAVAGLANWAYAAYRMSMGKEDNLALMIAGMSALVMALILFQQSRTGSDET